MKNMNILVKKMIVVCILCNILLVYACNETEISETIEIAVATVSATPENMTLAVGEIRAVKALITPDGANQEIYWKSADPNIATVANGIITGIAEGETTVTVNSIENVSKKDEVTIKVVAAPIPVDSIKIEVESTEIYIDDELPITVIIKPDNATGREILWQNSNPVAAVVENNRIKGLARGKTTITVLAGTNVNIKSSVEITVTDRSVPVESIAVSQTSLAMAAGTTKNITSIVAPNDATNKTLLWESDNSTVASAANGVIAAHSPGTAVIAVRSESSPDIRASITVEVSDLSSFPSLFAEAAGLWLFENPSDITKASIGSPLEMKGNPIVAIAGTGAVMVPKGGYFEAYHGIAANGGGSNVNEYTLMIDFRLPRLGVWYTFFQTDINGVPGGSNSGNDAECFINASNNLGVGVTGYFPASLTASAWFRLVVSLGGGAYKVYLNGTNISSYDVSPDSRFSLMPAVALLCDNDGEDADIDISNIAIWGRTLNDSEISALGTATP
jgi:uncharacterized protein YjdB